jgi:hypothetical protein
MWSHDWVLNVAGVAIFVVFLVWKIARGKAVARRRGRK